MKVAIMGAGLAGLSCAVLLERNCIIPDVYESEHKVGARFANTEAIMNLLDYPVKDSLRYIKDRYGVKVQPLNPLKSLIINGPGCSAKILGELGYITARGNYPEALEVQLGDLSRAKIVMNSYFTLDDLKERYDYVVVATGNEKEPMRQQVWETDVVANLLGANIIGSFDPNTAQVWLNDLFAPSGYCFLLPYNEKTASLTIAVPGTEGTDLEELWHRFLRIIDWNYEIKDTFSLYSYEIGRNKDLVKDKIIFVGNAGGFLMPFLGFGQFTSMLSGFEAAKAILKGNLKTYEESMEPLIKSYHHSLNMRKIISSMNNEWYDRVIRMLQIAPFNITFSKFPLPVLKAISAILSPLAARATRKI